MQLLIIIFKSAAVKDFLLSKLSNCSGVRIIPFGVKSSLKCAGIIPWNPQLLYEPMYTLSFTIAAIYFLVEPNDSLLKVATSNQILFK